MTQIDLKTHSLNIAIDIFGQHNNPTILFLHAGGETRSVWTPIVDHLHNLPWQIIVPDLRGHGQSDRANVYRFADFVEDIEIIIEELAGTPLIVVGGSIGGLIGFMIAGRPSSPVNGLISLDITPQPPAAAGMQERAKIASAIYSGVPQVSSIDPEMASGSLVQDIISNSPILRMRAKNISSPVLLIHGLRSKAVGEIEQQAFLDDIPHADVVSIDSGHLVARENPKLVADKIKDFISKNREWLQD